ncbi:MAG: anti-sigma factor [Flavobacteriaceae bacterium]
MKSILKLLALTIIVSFLISCSDDDPVTTKSLTLNIAGLDDLGSDYVYEGWIIVDGSPVSTGTFTSVTFPQTFTVNINQVNAATKFVLSIEPTNDNDPAPSNTKILAGDFSGDMAEVNTMLVGDFSNSSGKYILATPTDGMMNNENSGIWFLDPTSGTPMAGLDLPTLPAGWIYEGWAVINGKPVTTGTFTNLSGTDNFDDFSGSMSLPMPNGADGFFPGEDFLMAAPTGLSFPTDLAGGKAVISIEPVPDNSPMPFTLKPLAGDIPTMATDHTLYMLNQNLGSLPTGSVSR